MRRRRPLQRDVVLRCGLLRGAVCLSVCLFLFSHLLLSLLLAVSGCRLFLTVILLRTDCQY